MPNPIHTQARIPIRLTRLVSVEDTVTEISLLYSELTGLLTVPPTGVGEGEAEGVAVGVAVGVGVGIGEGLEVVFAGVDGSLEVVVSEVVCDGLLLLLLLLFAPELFVEFPSGFDDWLLSGFEFDEELSGLEFSLELVDSPDSPDSDDSLELEDPSELEDSSVPGSGVSSGSGVGSSTCVSVLVSVSGKGSAHTGLHSIVINMMPSSIPTIRFHVFKSGTSIVFWQIYLMPESFRRILIQYEIIIADFRQKTTLLPL